MEKEKEGGRRRRINGRSEGREGVERVEGRKEKRMREE